jgi:gas vesicle protein
MEIEPQSKGKILLMGGVIGALAGAGVALLLMQRAERRGEALRVSSGEGLRLGMLLLGMLREVAQLGS